MKVLFLAQGLDALRAPSGVEFTLLNAVTGRKPNEGRAENGTANTKAEKGQKPEESLAKQRRGFFVFDHFLSTFIASGIRAQVRLSNSAFL